MAPSSDYKRKLLTFLYSRGFSPAGIVYNRISTCLKSVIQRVSEAERKVTFDTKTRFDHKVQKQGLAE